MIFSKNITNFRISKVMLKIGVQLTFNFEIKGQTLPSITYRNIFKLLIFRIINILSKL